MAKSAPDGYTWLLAPDNVFSVNPHLGKQPFDPLTDLIPVTQLARIQFLLVVHPSLPVNSVGEFVAYAKARPRSSTTAPPATAARSIWAPRCSSSSPGRR